MGIYALQSLAGGFLDEETQKLQTHYQQKLTNLEELKKSILQKAFAGGVDVGADR